MKKFLVLGGIILVLFLSNHFAFCYTINDNYYGSHDHGYGDIIGYSNYFDVSGMDVSFNNGTLTVNIYSRYFDNIGQYQTQLGDLFISNDGWSPYGSAPFLQDDANNGEVWEYGLVLNNHLATSGSLNLYAIDDGTIINSYAPPGYTWRNNQEVQFNPTGAALATGAWSIIGLGTPSDLDDYLTMTIGYNNWGVEDSFGFHWATTCGNDVIEGAAPVPEPTTIFLMGSGLVGVGIFLRKRFPKPKN